MYCDCDSASVQSVIVNLRAFKVGKGMNLRRGSLRIRRLLRVVLQLSWILLVLVCLHLLKLRFSPYLIVGWRST